MITRRALALALSVAVALAPPAGVAYAAPAGDAVPSASPGESSTPPASLADTLTGETLRDYQTARTLLLHHDHVGALIRFTRLYGETHDPRLLANMGLCEKEMQRMARAADLFERAVSEGASFFAPDQLAQVEQLRDAALAAVAHLRVSVDVPGAAIVVDDRLVGTSPLAGDLRVDRGTHRVRVAKAGYGEWTRDIAVVEGETRHLQVDLEGDRGTPIWLWVTGATIAGVALVVAGVSVFHSSSSHETPGSAQSPLRVSW
ncbi:MAG: PEGA domain-containing protein [Polyangiaceae bacterium]|nr:PEGA domain-containing protein [Polyangiaceae bacterium]